jgi:hypothetical protein
LRDALGVVAERLVEHRRLTDRTVDQVTLAFIGVVERRYVASRNAR